MQWYISTCSFFQLGGKKKKINAFPLMHFRTPGEGKCIKIPLDKMWSLILCWGAGDRVNTYSIISQSHPSRRAPPPCHYVSPSHQPPAGFHVPAAISPLIQKHVSAWQKQGAESHCMRSLKGGDVAAEWSENLRWLKEVRINVLRPFLKIGWFLKDSIKLRLQSYHVLAKYFSSVFFSPWHVIHFQQAPWKWGKSIIYTSFVSLATCFTLAGSQKEVNFCKQRAKYAVKTVNQGCWSVARMKCKAVKN